MGTSLRTEHDLHCHAVARGDVPALFRRKIAEMVGKDEAAADLADAAQIVSRVANGYQSSFAGSLTTVVSGGKLLRPLLTLAAAYSATHVDRRARDRAVRAAAVVELLHQASLIHDDVMDESPLRHGSATLNVRFGNHQAVLAGDYLLAQSLLLGSELGPVEVAVAAGAFIRMCRGQAGECARLYDPTRDEEHYFRSIADKTGALFEAACRLGGMAAGLSDVSTQALAAFGLRLGIAFQLLDDILDFLKSDEAPGKPVGHDVVEGVYTLPLIRALRDSPELAAALSDADRAAGARRAMELVRSGETMTTTLATARSYADQAIAQLAQLGDDVRGDAVVVLEGLASILTR